MHVAYVFFLYPESTEPCRGQRLGRAGEEVRMMTGVRMIGELIRTEGRRSEDINVT